MLDIGLPELLIVLLVVLLLFGPGRLARVMGDLGKGLRPFKDGVCDEMKESSVQNAKPEGKK